MRQILPTLLFALALVPSVTAQNVVWPELSSPPAQMGGGEKDAAVIVGAENYAYVERIPGARKNANDWQAYLTGARGVPVERISLLLDDDATNDAIRQTATEKAALVEPGGTLWFLFIGHGAPSKDGKKGLLVGVDAQQKTSSIYSRSISREEVLEILAKGGQAKTVVLLDACFSGKTASGRALAAGLQPLVALREGLAGVDDRTILMTAARSDQFAGPLPGGARPAFSYLVLGALRGWAADAQGNVTADAAVDYARRVLSLAHDRAQTPELSTPEKARVVLGFGREEGPDLAKLQRESAASSGAGFSVTALPAVPNAETPKQWGATPSGLDLSRVNVDALEEYDSVVKNEKSDSDPEDKAAAWRQLGKSEPQFASVADRRAGEWDRFAAQKKTADEAREKRAEARDADWEKLERLLKLTVVSNLDKRAWTEQFLNAYWKSPGINTEMAQSLLPFAEDGPMREEIRALSLRSAVKEKSRPRLIRFALRAPAAESVQFSGEFAGRVQRFNMTRNPLGIWSIAVYLNSGRYRYFFVVDGREVLDPENSRTESNESLLIVP